VHVVIDGTSVAIPDDDDGNSTGSFADGISEQRHREEEFQESKIRDHFSFIPGLIATVTVDIDNTRQQVQKKEYDPKNAVQQEHEVSSRTDETHTDNPAPAEAGAGANLPVSLGEPAATGGNSTSSSTDEQKTSYDNYVGEVNTVLSIPAGRPTIVSATVRVPRSYFVREFGGSNAADAKPPDDAVLDGFIQKRLADMRSEVKAMMVLKSDADVFVTTFNDTAQAMIVADARAGRTGGLGSLSVQSILGRYAKQVAVGMLAVVSLGMVLMIVRKGAPAPVVAVEPEPEPPHRLSSGEHVAGEAGEGEAMLDGMELDEDTVKAQQMIAQVSTMVKENPDAAATLVKRWLNRA
jgi:flagellar biosynthesis/type III secretory pathway M-ring protein FliF/YscJ